MNDFFKNIDPNTLMKAKNAINNMLTEQQKQKLMQQFNGMSKEELLNRLGNMANSKNISNQDLENMLSHMDKETLLRKLNDLK
ncbi:hypothetical protein [Acetivibrio sp. MSJd-27]|jgi:hypothetical protein|uniref:hypothetical protein n=1 Tax=Acetivibrio sp. MSJd-27 TaxID=2841523 RepID=UPI0015AEBBCC|nr:hypothetical protein [Acetivibrio sp. MSJd-27]MBU5449321.1 hypothetical protein [Acetivibrio sp. MSJd-27]